MFSIKYKGHFTYNQYGELIDYEIEVSGYPESLVKEVREMLESQYSWLVNKNYKVLEIENHREKDGGNTNGENGSGGGDYTNADIDDDRLFEFKVDIRNSKPKVYFEEDDED